MELRRFGTSANWWSWATDLPAGDTLAFRIAATFGCSIEDVFFPDPAD